MIFIPIILLVLVAVWLISTYNGFVVLKERTNNAWSQVEIQLKRRYDLIPNLVNTVKGYATHERGTFEKITQARTAAMGAQSITDLSIAENQLSGTLKTLFAVAENYPELKADSNFKELQQELSNTESKIAFSRQFYNDTVQKYNVKVKVFPNSILAGMFNFYQLEYFNLEDEKEARKSIKVEF
ncbi:LemA family protein [Serpentinicella alkaliphila]|uniref:LemA protein n=1 Tax=Serpentinicella alkaliphila TaxID=1734049 RepID=A0A4R2TI12_9FIRM|nr:LemA family protein [Serpentinicella alkaliphila]QUH26480.1 LemA family protein [Serpentinicella alkaliphila]TCQ03240.1 LemA protein [Serpentinicella alkaliphila]